MQAEIIYRTYLRALVKRAYDELLKRLDLTTLATRLDVAPQHPSRRATSAVDGARAALRKLTDPDKVHKPLAKVIKAGDKTQRTRLEKEITLSPSAVTKGVKRELERFTAENVRLIRDVPQRLLDRCEALLHKGFEAGTRAPTLAKQLRAEFGIADRRAKLIARDQAGKLVSGLNQLRQTNAGIKRYVWRTVNNERTRPLHAERDGVVFSWDDPPHEEDIDGPPGFPINCCCYAEPVLDEDEEVTEPEEKAPEETPEETPEEKAP